MIDARNATPAETLEQRIMDPCAAKSEAEWWAHREIAKQRAEIERLREVIRTIRARCVELDDSDAVSETLDIATAVLEDEP